MTAAISACNWERPVKFVAQKGYIIRVCGLQILFAAGENRVFYPHLRAGRLKLADLPGRLELQQVRDDGSVRVLGQATYDAAGRFFVAGRPAADKKGPIVSIPGESRSVSAESLFPVLGRQKRVNYFVGNKFPRAFVVYGGKNYLMPIDPLARFGPAARQKRIYSLAIPDQERIHFCEQRPGREDLHIGWMRSDLTGAGLGRTVQVGEHIIDFNLKDRPVRITGGRRARVLFRGVTLSFRTEQGNLYYPDLVAGRLCLRIGYADRIEVVRKEGGAEKVLGAVRINDNCLIAGKKRFLLDQPKGSGPILPIEAAIEELGGLEVPIRYGRNGPYAAFKAFGTMFLFPMGKGNVYRAKLKAGLVVANVYESRIEIGYKEGDVFREIGRLEGEVLQELKSGGWVNLSSVIPEVGRVEKRLGPKPIVFTSRGVARYFNRRPNDRYFTDFRAGRLVYRAIGDRLEFFADREEGKEFIGTAPNRRDEGGSIDRLFPALRPGILENRELVRLLEENGCEYLSVLLSRGGANLLKRLSLFGRDYFSGPEVQEPLAVKLFFALAYGLERVAAGNGFSADLKEALGREIVELMALAADHPQLVAVRDSLISFCRDAYASFRSLKQAA